MALKEKVGIMYIADYMDGLKQLLEVLVVYQKIARLPKIPKLHLNQQTWAGHNLHLRVEEVQLRKRLHL